ncbi:MAG TPA: hypothetical protein QF480_00880 [Bacteroidales bacterium]|jgi:hypothetical protein|nr:hypothetical protein [Bacteroidales bacterium]
MENIKLYIEYVSNVVEAVGVITIFVGIICIVSAKSELFTSQI